LAEHGRSTQRILKHCALDGQYPKNPQEIIGALEAAARAGNRDPTPFVRGDSGTVTTCTIRRCHAKARYGYTIGT